MSATELLNKVEKFLREQTRIEPSLPQQSLQLVWQSAPVDPLADAVGAIRESLSLPTETFERPEPSPTTRVVAKVTGRPWTGPVGCRLKKIVWTLSDEQLPIVARWLDRYEPLLARHSGFAYAHRHLAYRWLPHHCGGHPEFPGPSIFGVALSHPRRISVPFYFYDADHYWRIKSYLAKLGLAVLLDNAIRPKGSLNHGLTAITA
jgi:hypothetical protein